MSRFLPLAGRAFGVLEDQADHQLGQRQLRLVGQTLPLRRRGRLRTARAVEQVELLWCRSAWHGHLPESPFGSPMLRSNPAIAMGRRKPLPRHSAMPAGPPGPRPTQVERSSAARTDWRPDRTSRPEPLANDRKQCRSGCSETPPSQPSQPSREREPADQPTGAMDREAHVLQSCGRSVTELYNLNRPHTSLDGLTPNEFATRSKTNQNTNRSNL